MGVLESLHLNVSETVLTQEAFSDWQFVARACGSGKK